MDDAETPEMMRAKARRWRRMALRFDDATARLIELAAGELEAIAERRERLVRPSGEPPE